MRSFLGMILISFCSIGYSEELKESLLNVTYKYLFSLGIVMAGIILYLLIRVTKILCKSLREKKDDKLRFKRLDEYYKGILTDVMSAPVRVAPYLSVVPRVKEVEGSRGLAVVEKDRCIIISGPIKARTGPYLSAVPYVNEIEGHNGTSPSFGTDGSNDTSFNGRTPQL